WPTGTQIRADPVLSRNRRLDNRFGRIAGLTRTAALTLLFPGARKSALPDRRSIDRHAGQPRGRMTQKGHILRNRPSPVEVVRANGSLSGGGRVSECRPRPAESSFAWVATETGDHHPGDRGPAGVVGSGEPLPGGPPGGERVPGDRDRRAQPHD